jgi:hypothetical protein
MGVVAEIARDEVEQAGLLSNVTVGCHTVALLHTSRVEELAQRFYAFEFVGILDDAVEGNVLRSRDLTESSYKIAVSSNMRPSVKRSTPSCAASMRSE